MEPHPGDRTLRRALALALAGALLLGALGWRWLQEGMDGLAGLPMAAAKAQLLLALAGCLGWLCLCLLAVSICFWRLGAEVVAQARFPLSDARVVRDVRKVEGAEAFRYGRGLQFFGAAVLVACACATMLGWRAYQALAGSVP